jgi:hypothetical protein
MKITKEADIQRMIVETLETLAEQNKLRYVSHPPMRTIIVFLPHAVWVIETKSQKGKFGEHQLLWQNWFLNAGDADLYHYSMPRTVKDANALIDALLKESG